MSTRNRPPATNTTRGENDRSRPTRDDLETANGLLTNIRGVEEAGNALERDAYIVQGERLTPQKLALVLFQAAAGTARMPRSALNVMRAIAYLLETVQTEDTARELAERIDRRIEASIGSKLAEVAESLNSSMKTCPR